MIMLIFAYLFMGSVLNLLVNFSEITESIKNREYSVLSAVTKFIVMGFVTPVMLMYGIIEQMIDYSTK
nr:MAG TPA: hypothetical protein [Caudoviricetes sp.]